MIRKITPTNGLGISHFFHLALWAAIVLQLFISHESRGEINVWLEQQDEQLTIYWIDTLSGEALHPDQMTYEVQTSTDLETWRPVGHRVERKGIAADASLSLNFAKGTTLAFFRVLRFDRPTTVRLSLEGEDVFGFQDTYDAALEMIGEIDLDSFSSRYPASEEIIDQITFDPTDARFWDRFNTSPAANNRADSATGRPRLVPTDPEYRATDFRLNASELDIFKHNGFVVSKRRSSGTFADQFYKLWKDDMPVFVSSDAILQAWHRSYDLMLVELEEEILLPGFTALFEAMSEQIPTLLAEAKSETMVQAVHDADYFLAVAISLLEGRLIEGQLGQGDRVAETRRWIRSENLITVPDLFGVCRKVDFSQFKPRGHYLRSENLSRYFQALMWCGRTDLRIAGGPFDDGCGPRMATARELGVAITFWDLIVRSKQLKEWERFNRLIETFVGPTDSMTFTQLDGLMATGGITSIADISEDSDLESIESQILDGSLGIRHIRSDYFYAPLGPERLRLPRSFTVSGQKFILDSWALSNVTFDSILWNKSKVGRRLPSGIDIAFSVLANDHTVPILYDRINNTAGVPFRDGLPFQHNLSATRDTLDQIKPESWMDNIYSSWLYTLRALSPSTATTEYPDALRTAAWTMKTLNTQLASWTHLRHDTLLYAVQSYTAIPICYFPAGFVEPRPEFWQRFGNMADNTARLLSAFDMNERVVEHQIQFFKFFRETCLTLERLSLKELSRTPFDDEDHLFIRNLIEEVGWSQVGSGGGVRKYDGWYPRLFYRPFRQRNMEEFDTLEGADKPDFVVADIHTNPPCALCGDPGAVLHQGVGQVDLLYVSADLGEGRTMFAGPVLSYYEFSVPGPPKRLNDGDWEGIVRGWLPNPFRVRAQAPEWTESYLK